jgi:hypothetical protein
VESQENSGQVCVATERVKKRFQRWEDIHLSALDVCLDEEVWLPLLRPGPF